ncbi:hypothetical protein [Noviherbaspirillum saxi]|uniref:MarR family protein n=1 Tax=Noviherbaspirillum saxi TaxID=2320863 RepID=A0A3A3FQZ3_9BURK|nr:hypothetical protein [Noviherbaspirillum saxi]RJF96159.1 hypothetical protein D3871_22800 [Noviherbaspirillum saxi]
MQQNYIPDEVKQFILGTIPSVPFLEAMLLIRAKAEHPWDGSRLAKRLYMTERAATDVLNQLHQAGLTKEIEGLPGFHCYAPSKPGVAVIIDQLASTYAQHLVEISNLIHSANMHGPVTSTASAATGKIGK